MPINIGDLFLSTLFPAYPRLKQMGQEEEINKRVMQAQDELTAANQRVTPMLAYPEAQVQEYNPNTGQYGNVAMQNSPSFKDALYEQLGKAGKLDEALMAQIPKQTTPEDQLDFTTKLWDFAKKQQDYGNQQEAGRIAGELQTANQIPEVANNQPARQPYVEAMKSNLANVAPTHKLLEPDTTKEAFKTPLPSTDKGWTLSSNNQGLTVARMKEPNGQIAEQPYNPSLHGRIVKPEEGVGLADNVNVGLTGEASMQNYTPQVQTLSRKLVAGEIPYPSAFALKDPLWKTVIQASADLDPGFNAQQYKIREATRKSFTSGADAKNVTSINTLVGHLESLSKSANALKNTDIPIWNKLANLGITAVGDARVTRFNMDLGAVESELAAVFKQTGATDQEIKAWRERINAAQSPAQLKTNIQEAVGLMGSRLEALKNKYDTAMGPFSQFQILSPKSRKILGNMVGQDVVDQFEPAKTTTTETKQPDTPPVKGAQKAPDGNWYIKSGNKYLRVDVQ